MARIVVFFFFCVCVFGPSAPTTYPATHPTTYPATYPATHPTTYPATHPTTYPATHPTTYPATHPTTYPATHLATTPTPLTTAQVWETQNLRGRMFSVMPGAAVRFHSSAVSNVTGITLCLRGLTDKKWMIDDGLQLTFGERNAFYITGSYSAEYQLRVAEFYPYVTFNVNSMVAVQEVSSVWKSRCVTWDSDSGMVQLWFDGRMSVRKGVSRGAVFSGQAELSMHQFEGQLSDVYLWDSVLSTRELYRYLYQLSVPSRGRVLDWTQMQFITSGYVVLEPAYSRRFLADPAKHNKQKRMKELRKRQRQEV